MKAENGFTIVITKSAAIDLLAIYNYVAEESNSKALKIIQKLESRISKLVTFPEQERVAPELENFNILIYREIVEYPWRIFYKIELSTVLIIAILDGRRNIEDLLMQRLLR
jgi:toxin ParE1/3/4